MKSFALSLALTMRFEATSTARDYDSNLVPRSPAVRSTFPNRLRSGYEITMTQQAKKLGVVVAIRKVQIGNILTLKIGPIPCENIQHIGCEKPTVQTKLK